MCYRGIELVSMKHMTEIRYRSNGSIVPLIREQGRSVAWLARQIGISRQFTSEIVHGHVSTSPEVAESITKNLQSTLFLLFDVSGSTDRETVEQVA